MSMVAGFEERYRAIEARDVRFDGQFVTAVRSTGIYCRPSCPARTPRRENVEFFATSAAAHEAGYRACKRCLPEAAPGSPLWNVRGDAVGRAMRLIGDGVVEREGVPGLAARLGYSSRHLTRLLTAELGAGPLALARAHRAHTARMLLVGTDLAAADVAFSSGFASVRQFNDTVREVFGMPPLELRARRRVRELHAPELHAPGAIDLALPFRAPMDAAGLFGWMAARAIPGVEVAASDAYARTLRLDGGPAWFRVRLDGGRLRLQARLTRLGDLPVLVARVRRLFDLDADPVAVDAALAAHPELRALVAATPGIRVPGASDPHEMLVRALVGQQVSVPAARTALARLAAALGERIPGPGGDPMRAPDPPGDVDPRDADPASDADLAHGRGPAEPGRGPASALEDDPAPRDATPRADTLFPAMAAIAERGAEVLRGPEARIRAIVGAAAALASGEVALSIGDDPEAQRAALLSLPGVGPWTADYVRMRVTGDPDVLLPGDLAVRRGAASAGIPAAPRALAAWAARVAPWRSYLTAHLWRAAAPSRPAPHDAGGSRSRPAGRPSRGGADPLRPAAPVPEETP